MGNISAKIHYRKYKSNENQEAADSFKNYQRFITPTIFHPFAPTVADLNLVRRSLSNCHET
jgi:hypothetical protein